MYTELLNASDRCVHDDIFCARLAAIHCMSHDGLPCMRFGLKGPRGTIYRIVEVQTLMDAIRLCELLREMGFAHDADCPKLKRRPVHRAYQSWAHLALHEISGRHGDRESPSARQAAVEPEHVRASAQSAARPAP